MNSVEHRSRNEIVQVKIENQLQFPYEHLYTNEFLNENAQEKSILIQPTNFEKETNENEHLSIALAYKKRLRIKFTQEQLDVLETTFEQHHYPTVDMVDELVERLDLPTQKITVWFQNRRARLKKSQPKFDDDKFEIKTEPPQCDSGIHLEEDFSCESTLSSAPQSLFQPPSAVSTSYLTSCGQYFSTESTQPMWPSFHYSLPMSSYPTNMSNATNPLLPTPFNYNSTEIFSPFVFHEISNYHYQQEFSGDL